LNGFFAAKKGKGGGGGGGGCYRGNSNFSQLISKREGKNSPLRKNPPHLRLCVKRTMGKKRKKKRNREEKKEYSRGPRSRKVPLKSSSIGPAPDCKEGSLSLAAGPEGGTGRSELKLGRRLRTIVASRLLSKATVFASEHLPTSAVLWFKGSPRAGKKDMTGIKREKLSRNRDPSLQKKE